MEMHQVRYFLAVAEVLNFTRAAELCNVTQPTMTRAIKLLEHELGASLLNRERGQTHLTEFGRMMLPHLQQIWAQAVEAKRKAEVYNTSDRTVLTLGVMCTIAPPVLMQLVRAMRKNHPSIELQITDATSAALNEKLIAGELDVAILAQPEPFSQRLHQLPLYREPFVVAVSHDDRLAGSGSVRVRDLHGMSYLERINCEFADAATLIFEAQGVRDVTIYRSDRDDWVLAMAAAGMGYSFIPEQCVAGADVAVLRLVDPEFWREVSLITVRGRPHSTQLGALVREATRLFRRTLDTAPGSPEDEPAES